MPPPSYLKQERLRDQQKLQKSSQDDSPKTNLRFLQLAVTILCIHGCAAVFTEGIFTSKGFKYGVMYAYLECFLYGWLVPLEAFFGFGVNTRFYSRKEYFTALGVGRLRQSLGDENPGFISKLLGKIVPEFVWQRMLGDDDERKLTSDSVRGAKKLEQMKKSQSSLSFRVRDAIATGFVYAIAHGAGVAAFVYVNITFAALAKSAKVPLTLTFAMFMQRNFRPSWQEAVGVILFYVGLVMFGFGEKYESPKFELFGVVLLGINLAFGSVSANLQQRVLQESLEGGDDQNAAGKRAAPSNIKQITELDDQNAAGKRAAPSNIKQITELKADPSKETLAVSTNEDGTTQTVVLEDEPEFPKDLHSAKHLKQSFKNSKLDLVCVPGKGGFGSKLVPVPRSPSKEKRSKEKRQREAKEQAEARLAHKFKKTDRMAGVKKLREESPAPDRGDRSGNGGKNGKEGRVNDDEDPPSEDGLEAGVEEKAKSSTVTEEVAQSGGSSAMLPSSKTTNSDALSAISNLNPEEQVRRKKLAISLLMTTQYFAAGCLMLVYLILTGELYESIAWYFTSGGSDGGLSRLPEILGGQGSGGNSDAGTIPQEFHNIGLGMLHDNGSSYAATPSASTASYLIPPTGNHIIDAILSSNPITFPTRNLVFLQYLITNWNPHYYALICTFFDDQLTYLGMYALFSLSQEFDATRTGATCSIRKAVTFVLSYFLFPKAFSMKWHGVGLLLIFGGFSCIHLGAEKRRQGSGSSGGGSGKGGSGKKRGDDDADGGWNSSDDEDKLEDLKKRQ